MTRYDEHESALPQLLYLKSGSRLLSWAFFFNFLHFHKVLTIYSKRKFIFYSRTINSNKNFFSKRFFFRDLITFFFLFPHGASTLVYSSLNTRFCISASLFLRYSPLSLSEFLCFLRYFRLSRSETWLVGGFESTHSTISLLLLLLYYVLRLLFVTLK